MRAISLRTISTGLGFLALSALAAGASAQSVGAASASDHLLVPTMDFDGIEPTAADPECEQGVRRRAVRSRNPGPLSWLFGFDRAVDADRPERSFAFYLRSPLLSGLYGCPPSSGAKPPEPVDECAELTITTAAYEEHRIQVLLPQLHAKSARRLRGRIEEQLENGRAVTVIMTGGEPFSIIPDAVREVEARECRRGVWNEP